MKVPEPRKLPSGSYYVQLRLGGESIPVTEKSLTACKKKAALIKAQYMNGQRERKFNKDMTLGEAVDDYISSRENLVSPATIRGYKVIRNNRFKGYMDKKLSSITDWSGMLNDEAGECSAKTLKNAWFLVVPALSRAGIAKPNVTLPQVVVNEHLYLTYEEIPLFIKAVQGRACEIAALLALHSLRRSEVYALDWKDVDLKKDIIFVNGAAVMDYQNKVVFKKENKNKTSRRRIPIMIPELKKALMSIDDKTGRVVKTHINTAFYQVNKICKDAGLPEVGMHGLRHSFASLAYHLGLSERMTMQLGGWSDTKTMQNIYTHLASADISNSENLMKDFFKNAHENAHNII